MKKARSVIKNFLSAIKFISQIKKAQSAIKIISQIKKMRSIIKDSQMAALSEKPHEDRTFSA